MMMLALGGSDDGDGNPIQFDSIQRGLLKIQNNSPGTIYTMLTM